MDGNWAEWSEWGNCDIDCYKKRTRECKNPAPFEGGADCPGNSSETESCCGGDCWGKVNHNKEFLKKVYLLSDLKQISNRIIFLESSSPKGCFYASQVFDVFEEIEMEDNSPCTCTRYCQNHNYTLAHMKAG